MRGTITDAVIKSGRQPEAIEDMAATPQMLETMNEAKNAKVANDPVAMGAASRNMIMELRRQDHDVKQKNFKEMDKSRRQLDDARLVYYNMLSTGQIERKWESLMQGGGDIEEIQAIEGILKARPDTKYAIFGKSGSIKAGVGRLMDKLTPDQARQDAESLQDGMDTERRIRKQSPFGGASITSDPSLGFFPPSDMQFAGEWTGRAAKSAAGASKEMLDFIAMLGSEVPDPANPTQRTSGFMALLKGEVPPKAMRDAQDIANWYWQQYGEDAHDIPEYQIAIAWRDKVKERWESPILQSFRKELFDPATGRYASWENFANTMNNDPFKVVVDFADFASPILASTRAPRLVRLANTLENINPENAAFLLPQIATQIRAHRASLLDASQVSDVNELGDLIAQRLAVHGDVVGLNSINRINTDQAEIYVIEANRSEYDAFPYGLVMRNPYNQNIETVFGFRNVDEVVDYMQHGRMQRRFDQMERENNVPAQVFNEIANQVAANPDHLGVQSVMPIEVEGLIGHEVYSIQTIPLDEGVGNNYGLVWFNSHTGQLGGEMVATAEEVNQRVSGQGERRPLVERLNSLVTSVEIVDRMFLEMQDAIVESGAYLEESDVASILQSNPRFAPIASNDLMVERITEDINLRLNEGGYIFDVDEWADRIIRNLTEEQISEGVTPPELTDILDWYQEGGNTLSDSNFNQLLDTINNQLGVEGITPSSLGTPSTPQPAPQQTQASPTGVEQVDPMGNLDEVEFMIAQMTGVASEAEALDPASLNRRYIQIVRDVEARVEMGAFPDRFRGDNPNPHSEYVDLDADMVELYKEYARLTGVSDMQVAQFLENPNLTHPRLLGEIANLKDQYYGEGIRQHRVDEAAEDRYYDERREDTSDLQSTGGGGYTLNPNAPNIDSAELAQSIYDYIYDHLPENPTMGYVMGQVEDYLENDFDGTGLAELAHSQREEIISELSAIIEADTGQAPISLAGAGSIELIGDVHWTMRNQILHVLDQDPETSGVSIQRIERIDDINGANAYEVTLDDGRVGTIRNGIIYSAFQEFADSTPTSSRQGGGSTPTGSTPLGTSNVAPNDLETSIGVNVETGQGIAGHVHTRAGVTARRIEWIGTRDGLPAYRVTTVDGRTGVVLRDPSGLPVTTWRIQEHFSEQLSQQDFSNASLQIQSQLDIEPDMIESIEPIEEALGDDLAFTLTDGRTGIIQVVEGQTYVQLDSPEQVGTTTPSADAPSTYQAIDTALEQAVGSHVPIDSVSLFPSTVNGYDMYSFVTGTYSGIAFRNQQTDQWAARLVDDPVALAQDQEALSEIIFGSGIMSPQPVLTVGSLSDMEPPQSMLTHNDPAEIQPSLPRGSRGSAYWNIRLQEPYDFDAIPENSRDFRYTDLRGASMVNENLQLNFEGSDFTGADLRGANLRDANLSSVNFTGADLRGADLRGANIDMSNFTNVQIDEFTQMSAEQALYIQRNEDAHLWNQSDVEGGVLQERSGRYNDLLNTDPEDL